MALLYWRTGRLSQRVHDNRHWFEPNGDYYTRYEHQDKHK
jgi:hypothetical protein